MLSGPGWPRACTPPASGVCHCTDGCLGFSTFSLSVGNAGKLVASGFPLSPALMCLSLSPAAPNGALDCTGLHSLCLPSSPLHLPVPSGQSSVWLFKGSLLADSTGPEPAPQLPCVAQETPASNPDVPGALGGAHLRTMVVSPPTPLNKQRCPGSTPGPEPLRVLTHRPPSSCPLGASPRPFCGQSILTAHPIQRGGAAHPVLPVTKDWWCEGCVALRHLCCPVSGLQGAFASCCLLLLLCPSGSVTVGSVLGSLQVLNLASVPAEESPAASDLILWSQKTLGCHSEPWLCTGWRGGPQCCGGPALSSLGASQLPLYGPHVLWSIWQLLRHTVALA